MKIHFSLDFINEIIDCGNFGQSTKNRKLSAFFARKVLSISTSQQGEIYELSDRIYRLATDSEKEVKIEVSKAFKLIYNVCIENDEIKIRNLEKNGKKLKKKYTLFNADRVCNNNNIIGEGKRK